MEKYSFAIHKNLEEGSIRAIQYALYNTKPDFMHTYVVDNYRVFEPVGLDTDNYTNHPEDYRIETPTKIDNDRVSFGKYGKTIINKRR